MCVRASHVPILGRERLSDRGEQRVLCFFVDSSLVSGWGDDDDYCIPSFNDPAEIWSWRCGCVNSVSIWHMHMACLCDCDRSLASCGLLPSRYAVRIELLVNSIRLYHDESIVPVFDMLTVPRYVGERFGPDHDLWFRALAFVRSIDGIIESLGHLEGRRIYHDST